MNAQYPGRTKCDQNGSPYPHQETMEGCLLSHSTECGTLTAIGYLYCEKENRSLGELTLIRMEMGFTSRGDGGTVY